MKNSKAMLFLPEQFEIELGGLSLQIRLHEVGDRKVFEIKYPDGRPNLFISRSVVWEGNKVWMSIPEGRQEEAVLIGSSIVAYFQQQQSQQ